MGDSCRPHAKDASGDEQLRLAFDFLVAETRTDEAKQSAPSVPVTVGDWGDRWLGQRQRAGFRAWRSTRAAWRTHVPASWSALPLTEISPVMVREWWASLCGRRAAGTCANVLVVVRAVFEAAREMGAIASNPCAWLRVPRTLYARTDDARWLDRALGPGVQARLLHAIREPERWIVAFAMGTGLRKGEQWALRLEDVKADNATPHVVVRFSRPGFPTKGGQPRRVPLFGLGLDAARAWLATLDRYAPNPHALMFPSGRGRHRHAQNACRGWERALRLLGLTKTRWHDLRHTAGTSLVNGWWGRRWTLEEVQRLLGHATVTMTERYARTHDELLTRAAAESADGWRGLLTRTTEQER